MKKENKGITLVALVITIIILLILAAISIHSLIGDEGVLNNAFSKKATHEKEQYAELIELIKENTLSQIRLKKLEDKKYFINVAEQLENDPKFKGIKFSETENGEYKTFEDLSEDLECLYALTKEGYKYFISRKLTLILDGRKIEIADGDIGYKITYQEGHEGEDGYTNEDIRVKLFISEEKLEELEQLGMTVESIQYYVDIENNNNIALLNKNITARYPKITSRSDLYTRGQASNLNESWQTYNDNGDGILISENCTINVRIVTNVNVSEVEQIVIDKIDKKIPEIEDILERKSNKIKVSATDDFSGISSYNIGESSTIDDNNWEKSSNTSYTFNNLVQNKTYYISVKDKAGNISESYGPVVTNKVEGLVVEDIEFICDPSTDVPTNKNIEVEILIKDSEKVEKYILQYCILDKEMVDEGEYDITDLENNENWKNYTEPFPIEKNSYIYARLFDGTNGGGYAPLIINCIDKTKPSAPEIKIAGSKVSTYNNGTSTLTINYYNGSVDITITEGSDTGTDASGIQETIYTITNVETNEVYTSDTYLEKIPFAEDGQYKITAETYDKAGNVSEKTEKSLNVCMNHTYASNNKKHTSHCKYCSKCAATVAHITTTTNTYTKGANTHAWTTTCTVCSYQTASGNHSVTSTDTGTVNNPVWKYTCSSCGNKDITNLTQW